VVGFSFVRTFTSFSAPATQPRRTGKRTGFFSRVVEALAASNRRRAEREIARFIVRNGGKITDDLEREIERTGL
jgi:dephospho-CoA kinase